MLLITLPTGAVAKYYNERVCVLSVCLSMGISPEPHAIIIKFFVHVAYGVA